MDARCRATQSTAAAEGLRLQPQTAQRGDGGSRTNRQPIPSRGRFAASHRDEPPARAGCPKPHSRQKRREAPPVRRHEPSRSPWRSEQKQLGIDASAAGSTSSLLLREITESSGNRHPLRTSCHRLGTTPAKGPQSHLQQEVTTRRTTAAGGCRVACGQRSSPGHVAEKQRPLPDDHLTRIHRGGDSRRSPALLPAVSYILLLAACCHWGAWAARPPDTGTT